MSIKEPLTEKEQLVYDYIEETINNVGYPPTVRDICKATGIKSTSTVYSIIGFLKQKDYLSHEERKSRAIRPTYDNTQDSVRVPIIGRVTAGVPILAIENREGYVDFTPQIPISNKKDLFALKVHGTSMIEAGIFDGDIVIIRKTQNAKEGEIVVALLEDECTVKTFYREGKGFRLQPENKTMEPIYTDKLEIIGKVIASVRYYD